MITDPDLAAAVKGREHWRPAGEAEAVYDPGGSPALVRVGRIANPPKTGPMKHDRYFGVVVQGRRALHTASFGFAAEAVRWAERQRLS